jgi:hypothetical protein
VVTGNRKIFRKITVGLCSILVFITNASAEVTARVDRLSVDLNESFVLEIVVEGGAEMAPDLSVLDENFYQGQLSQLSNTTIVNGQISRSRTWKMPLMAKSTGKQEIPEITVGNEKSKPITILINEPSNAPPGEADVFISSEVDQAEVFVQSQILYRYKIYRAVATRQEGRRDPSFTGAEVLIERVGEERRYDAILNDRQYNVIEGVLAIYPQSNGEISISPARFEARVLRDGRITGRKIFESESHTIKVLPIPAPPLDYPDAAWLPAKDVVLSEEWSREPDKLATGEPLTRKVTISSLGQIETQIPALDPPAVEGMNVYADKPDLSRVFEAEGIRGVRRDQYAMIAVRGGSIKIPKIELPWFDIEAGEWRVAELPGRSIVVDTPAVAETPAIDAESDSTSDDSTEALTPSASDGFWQRVSQLIAGLWLLTVVAWWWTSRDREQQAREPEPPPIYKQQAKFVKAARKAAAAGDKAAVRDALIQWARLQWPNDSPRNIGDLAVRVASPLSEELQALSARSYGTDDGEWSGDAIANSLRSIKLAADEALATDENPLPPLLPPST